MKDWRTVALIACVLALCYVCNDYRTQNRELVDAHHDYVRRTELRQAEIQGRLETLEAIGVKINVVDHTGIWMISGVEVTK